MDVSTAAHRRGSLGCVAPDHNQSQSMSDPQTPKSTTAVECLPPVGRLLGVDYGTVRIGLAISNLDQTLASPLEVYHRQEARRMSRFFLDLIAAEQVVGLVVGWPIHTSGAASEKSREAETFARWLREQTQRPAVLFDERYTTALAREILNQSNLSGKKRRERLDKIAAQVLLSAYLESPDKAHPLDVPSESPPPDMTIDDGAPERHEGARPSPRKQNRH